MSDTDGMYGNPGEHPEAARDIDVRLARRDEIEEILRLWSTAGSPRASVPERSASIERLIEQEALLVAASGGRVVGALIAAWDGWRGNMYRLAVAEAERRRGIGLQLVAAGEELLRGRGAERITALVAHDDRGAVSLWTAAGYSLDREMGRFVRNL
jgi:ribosomal protein S18 acetylase RimI-like enzyme